MKVGSCSGFNFLGYSNILKTEWKRGHLPTVKKGFYGDTLTKRNLSLEHLKAKSEGGATALSNLVLASKEKNNLRGNQDIRLFANRKNIIEYFMQFVGVKTKRFDGDKYIAAVLPTLKELGIKL